MPRPFSVSIPTEELQRFNWDALIDITNTPYGTYTSQTTALALLLLGERPHPLCDAGHEFAPDWHTKGYTDKTGDWHAPCSSPGKAPLTKGYQRFAEQPPSASEVIHMFRGRCCNFGGVVAHGEARLDLDHRSGGEDSLYRYEREFGELPPTPQTLTGGGGAHFRLRLPDGVQIKAGGSFASSGYQGLEWKGPGANVVLPGSLHVSGRQYFYELANGPDVSVAAIPESLLRLILADPARIARSKRCRSGAGGGLTGEEVMHIFRNHYQEGERRAGSGLPRLVGILMSRGVDEETTVDFLLEWQYLHFSPPLASEVLIGHIRDLYGRYGPPDEDRLEAGKLFLGRLKERLIRTQSSPVSVNGSNTSQLLNEQDTHERSSRAQWRKRKLFEVREHAASIPKVGVDFVTLGKRSNWLVTFSTSPNFPINLADYSKAPQKNQLLSMVTEAEGEESTAARSLSNCLKWLAAFCRDHPNEHGERFRSRRTCKLHVHSGCLTRTAYRISLIDLPDLSEGQAYRSIWLGITYPTNSDVINGEQNHSDIIDKVALEIRKLVHRKEYKRKILSRGLGFYLTEDRCLLQLRLMFKEDREGETDAAVGALCANLNAKVIADRTYLSGETAVLQLLEDTSCALLGIEAQGNPAELFGPWWFATRRQHLFQAMASLYRLVIDVEDVESTCDLCGGPLVFREPEETSYDAMPATVEHSTSRSPP